MYLVTYFISTFVSTLRSLINVGLRLLIWKLFIQGYFLITEAALIYFQIFSRSNIFFYFDSKKKLNILVHEDQFPPLIHIAQVTLM